MDPESSGLQPESLLGLAVRRLSLRDFSGSRHYALLAKESDPGLSGPNQIIAIADVLLAAGRRLPGNHIDYYSMLQVPQSDINNRSLLLKQYMDFLFHLNPSKNDFPFAREAYNHVRSAGSVLVNPQKKTQYDNEIKERADSCNGFGDGHESQKNEEDGDDENGLNGSRKGSESDNGVFWTLCPYCYYMHQYEKLYKECCLLCQNCRRGFHAVAVALPRHRVVVEGVEYYYGFGFFPIGFDWESSLSDKKMDGVENNQGMDNTVIISDDSEDDGDGVNMKDRCSQVKQDVDEESKAEMTMKRSEGTKKRAMLRAKSVARKMKKIRGNLADSGSEEDSGGVNAKKDCSDDCGDSSSGVNTKKDSSEMKQDVAEGSKAESLMKRSEMTEKRVMQKVKSVARNSKKMMGKLVKRNKVELETVEETSAEVGKEIERNDCGNVGETTVANVMDLERYEDELSSLWEDHDAYVNLGQVLHN